MRMSAGYKIYTRVEAKELFGDDDVPEGCEMVVDEWCDDGTPFITTSIIEGGQITVTRPYASVGDPHNLGSGEIGILHGIYCGDAGDETDGLEHCV